jgi:hypothetical protein
MANRGWPPSNGARRHVAAVADHRLCAIRPMALTDDPHGTLADGRSLQSPGLKHGGFDARRGVRSARTTTKCGRPLQSITSEAEFPSR